MYSIVMLTAMSAGADVPAAHPGAGCYGGCFGGMSGCHGWAASCHGGCFGSCMGSRHGCRGGGFLGLRHKSRHGCNGCAGYSCSGWSCFGSCHGSWGSCHGAWGSCYGSGFGGCHGSLAPYSIGCYGDPHATYGRTYYPNQPPVVTVPASPPPMEKPAGSDAEPMGANLKFKVPADAKIFVDGKPTPGAGTERAFYTPPLERGKKFYYEVKAELVVNGKTVTEEKKVVVEAGANITEEFSKLTAAVAAKPDNVAGN